MWFSLQRKLTQKLCSVVLFLFSVQDMSSKKTFRSIFEGKHDFLEEKIDVEHGLLSKLVAAKVITDRHKATIEVKVVTVDKF